MDGELIFDTKIDNKGFDDGVKKIEQQGKSIGDSFEQSLAQVEAVADKTGKGLVKNFRKAYDEMKKTSEQAKDVKRQIQSIEGSTRESLKGITAPFSGKSYEESLELATGTSLSQNKEYQKLLEQYAELNTQLKEQRKNYYATGEAVNDYIGKLQNSANEVKNLNNKVEETNKKTNKVVNSCKRTEKEMGLLGKAVNKLAKRFKLLIVAMVIRGAINAVKDGFEDLTEYSQRFNKTVGEMKSSFTQARNSISTAFAPILEALAPTIIKITDAFSSLMETVTMYTTALFTNSKTYIKAKKSANEYASTVKKINKELAGFDTIQRLGSPDTSSGTSVSDMFEEVEIPENVVKNAEKMKAIFEELKENGELIGILGLVALAVSKLIKLFQKKNTTLEDQTEDTKEETKGLKSLIPQLAGAGAGAWALSRGLKNVNENPLELPSIDGEGFQEQLNPATEGVYAFADATQEANETIGQSLGDIETSFEKTGEVLPTVMDGINTGIQEPTEGINEKIEGVKNNIIEFPTAVEQTNENSKAAFEDLEENSSTFATNMSDNFKKVGIAMLLYPAIALKNTAENFATWGTETSKIVVSWGTNLIENIGKTMSSWYNTFTSALESAWESFIGFMEGTGERIKNWWSGAKKWVAPVGLGLAAVGLTAGVIMSGGSLGAAAAMLAPIGLASGTVVPANNGEFLAMLGDNKRETEIVSPLSTMKQAVREVLAEMGQQDLTATVPVYWNGEKIYEQVEKVKARRGGRLVKGGV